MEYATRHPDRVSHLILVDTAPASVGDWQFLREEFGRRRPPADAEAMEAIAATDAFQRGDLEAEAAYYRIHFRMTLRRPELLEALVARLRSNYTADGVVLARAIEHGCTTRPPARRTGICSPRCDSSTSRPCCSTASTTSSRSSWRRGSRRPSRERGSRCCPDVVTSPSSRRRSCVFEEIARFYGVA